MPFASKEAFSRHSCHGEHQKSSASSDYSVFDNPSQVRLKTSETRPASAIGLGKSSSQTQVQKIIKSLQSNNDDYFGHDHDEIHPEEMEWMVASANGKLDTMKS